MLHDNLEVYSYEISVLKLAISKFPEKHTLSIIPQPDINQERILANLRESNDEFNIFFTGFSATRESQFLQVDFPISRGLLGHRIFIIRKNEQSLFQDFSSLNELKEKLIIGSGVGWPDTDIFIAAGFKVQTAAYENLWKMLSLGRFTAFNRGIHEAYVEIKQRKPAYGNLMVDTNVMIVYPFDYFFYSQTI